MDPEFLSGLGKIRIMHIGIIYIGIKGLGPSNLSCLDENLDCMSGLSRVACTIFKK